ncbi:MAG: hypothetical protein HZC10_07910 [Nitrospirae bacterium]|nr:hypothetical protein [Nitrospirota bacterium]
MRTIKSAGGGEEFRLIVLAPVPPFTIYKLPVSRFETIPSVTTAFGAPIAISP